MKRRRALRWLPDTPRVHNRHKMLAALRNLQAALDEGFVTQQEYDKRRKGILDGATALSNEQGQSRASKGKGAKPGSVFDRLGEVDAGADASSWGHGGFDELYGSGAAKAAKGQRKGKAASGRTVVVTKANGGDLRNKLSGGGGIHKPVRGRGNKPLPDKCPW